MQKVSGEILSFFFFLALLTFSSQASDGGDKVHAENTWQRSNRSFVKNCYASPCATTGDFDGDGKKDKAFLIINTTNKKKGIAIISGRGESIIIGPGNPIGNGGDDYSWLNSWHVVDKSERKTLSRYENSPPFLKGEALYVAEKGAASALIYWDGTSYQWHQLGD